MPGPEIVSSKAPAFAVPTWLCTCHNTRVSTTWGRSPLLNTTSHSQAISVQHTTATGTIGTSISSTSECLVGSRSSTGTPKACFPHHNCDYCNTCVEEAGDTGLVVVVGVSQLADTGADLSPARSPDDKASRTQVFRQ